MLVETISDFYLPQEAVFAYIANVFLNRYFILGGGNDLVPSRNHKLFFLYSSHWRGIFSLVETVYFTWDFFPTSRNRHWYGKLFLRETLSLLVKTLASGNHFLPLPEIISISSSPQLVEAHFSVQKNCFLSFLSRWNSIL